jgi:uncharacterized protein (DUF305 family)
MRSISTKNSLLVLVGLGIFTTTNGLITACSKTTASIQSNSQTIAQHDGTMHHGGGMNHNMSMDLGAADADYDLRFIDTMMLHHQGAVDMAQAVLKNSQRPEMKKLANDIIVAQKKEIEQMRQWRKAWYPKADSRSSAWNAAMGHMMPMSEEQKKGMMMSMDLGNADANFDLRFLDAMIPHHEGALVMAKDALNKSKRPEMKQLAENILTSQQQEIEQMKQWRKDWYEN